MPRPWHECQLDYGYASGAWRMRSVSSLTKRQFYARLAIIRSAGYGLSRLVISSGSLISGSSQWSSSSGSRMNGIRVGIGRTSPFGRIVVMVDVESSPLVLGPRRWAEYAANPEV